MNNISIGPGLIAYWLSCLQMPSDVKWRKKEKRNDKEHHEKSSFVFI